MEIFKINYTFCDLISATPVPGFNISAALRKPASIRADPSPSLGLAPWAALCHNPPTGCHGRRHRYPVDPGRNRAGQQRARVIEPVTSRPSLLAPLHPASLAHHERALDREGGGQVCSGRPGFRTTEGSAGGSGDRDREGGRARDSPRPPLPAYVGMKAACWIVLRLPCPGTHPGHGAHMGADEPAWTATHSALSSVPNPLPCHG